MRPVNAGHLAGKLAKVAHAEGLNIHNMSHSSTARGHEIQQIQKKAAKFTTIGYVQVSECVNKELPFGKQEC